LFLFLREIYKVVFSLEGMIKKSGSNKKGIKIFLAVLILLILGLSFYFFRSDPANLRPSENVATGKAVYLYQPLTAQQLNKGFNLDRGWNSIFWTEDLKQSLPIKEVFGSILENTYYIYSYDERKYWFNPTGIYGKYNKHSYYKSRLLETVEPGERLGIYLKESSRLKYAVEVPVVIYLPSGEEIFPSENEVVCVDNKNVVYPLEQCEISSDCPAPTKNRYCEGNRTACVTPSSYNCKSNLCVKELSLSACVVCPNGCLNGFCIELNKTCIDSDVTSEYPDGKNLYVKGVVKFKGVENEDSCTSGHINLVNEQVCSVFGSAATYTLACNAREICKDGACVKSNLTRDKEIFSISKVLPSSKNYKITFRNFNNDRIILPLVYSENFYIYGGEKSGKSLILDPQVRPITKNDYFILNTANPTSVSNNARTFVLQYKGTDKTTDTGAKMKFNILGSDSRREVSVNSVGSASLKLGGTTFRFLNASNGLVDDFPIKLITEDYSTNSNGLITNHLRTKNKGFVEIKGTYNEFNNTWESSLIIDDLITYGISRKENLIKFEFVSSYSGFGATLSGDNKNEWVSKGNYLTYTAPSGVSLRASNHYLCSNATVIIP